MTTAQQWLDSGATPGQMEAAAHTLLGWLGRVTPATAESPIYAAMQEASRLAGAMQYQELAALPTTPDTAERVGDWLVDRMATDLACGAGFCSFDDWQRVAQVEALTGRDLSAEAYASLS